MDNSELTPANLPTKQDITYLYNSRLKKYEPYDLITGKKVGTEIAEDFKLHYTTEIGDYICDKVREGMTLTKIVALLPDVSLSQVYAWKATIPVFKERLNEARKQRAESFQDKAIDLAIDNVGIDSKEVASVRLAVDTLKWAAEKNDPDRFGKKEEGAGKSGGNSVKIVLNTGVLDTVMPSNIVVDETGNFLGFKETDNGNGMDESGWEDGAERRSRETEETSKASEGSGIIEGDFFEI